MNKTGRPMLTRRIFTVLGAAFAITAASRPSWGARAVAVDGDDAVSPRLLALGDGWEEAGRAFEAQRHVTYYKDMEPGIMRAYSTYAPELVALRDKTRAMLSVAAELFWEPSRSRADVLLKYHVIDDLCSWRVVHNEAAIIAAGGPWWHGIVEREAEVFGLHLNYFWLSEAPPYAEIDGDRNSPKWAAVGRWRTERYSRV